MPRRGLSESGYYHIVVRSAGKVALFEDDADRRCYLRLLKDARDKTGAHVIAWVLMTNHVHLVVDFGESPSSISDFMFSIDLPYSKYFNARTGREGTLFQGSFWSKPITDDAQLVLRAVIKAVIQLVQSGVHVRHLHTGDGTVHVAGHESSYRSPSGGVLNIVVAVGIDALDAQKQISRLCLAGVGAQAQNLRVLPDLCARKQIAQLHMMIRPFCRRVEAGDCLLQNQRDYWFIVPQLGGK